MPTKLLILGGTAEAVALAQALADTPDVRVTTALAGRTLFPRLPPGEVRVGGFGGAPGLAVSLRENHIDRVIDATHPFAARMGANAVQACALADVPLLRLERPAWMPVPGDRWTEIADWQQAVEALNGKSRVLLALGRQDLAAFAVLRHVWFLIRSVHAPEPMPPFAQAEILLARGPFTIDGEIELLQSHGIDTIVCKNSGGTADAKLAAARALGLAVIMRQRPPRPPAETVATVAAALDWLKR